MTPCHNIFSVSTFSYKHLGGLLSIPGLLVGRDSECGDGGVMAAANCQVLTQDLPLTKIGNITVKNQEFQSVNLVISKLTAMFKGTR